MEYLISSFARRVGKALSNKSQNLLKDVLPHFLVPDHKIEDLNQVFQPITKITFDSSFVRDLEHRSGIYLNVGEDSSTESTQKLPAKVEFKKYALDIGFGFGEQLAENANIKSNIGFIGCEPFLNGIANLLGLIQEKKLNNIRLWKDDARKLIINLPDNSLDETYLLFADPWPKKKQNKRRLVSEAFLTLLASKIKKGGKFYLATDFKPYAKWIHQHLAAHPNFKNTHTQLRDYKTFPSDWIKSRYHQKAESKGLKPFYFCYEKI